MVNNPDCDCKIRSDIEELMQMSKVRGKLKDAIAEIKHIMAAIHAKSLAATDDVKDKPNITAHHQTNAIKRRQATSDDANNEAGMDVILAKGRVTRQGHKRAHTFKRGAVNGPYNRSGFEDSNQAAYNEAMYYKYLANHLDDLDNPLVKSDSSIVELSPDNNDNFANTSSSRVLEIPIDRNNKSPMTDQDTTMKARHTHH